MNHEITDNIQECIMKAIKFLPYFNCIWVARSLPNKAAHNSMHSLPLVIIMWCHQISVQNMKTENNMYKIYVCMYQVNNISFYLTWTQVCSQYSSQTRNSAKPGWREAAYSIYWTVKETGRSFVIITSRAVQWSVRQRGRAGHFSKLCVCQHWHVWLSLGREAETQHKIHCSTLSDVWMFILIRLISVLNHPFMHSQLHVHLNHTYTHKNLESIVRNWPLFYYTCMDNNSPAQFFTYLWVFVLLLPWNSMSPLLRSSGMMQCCRWRGTRQTVETVILRSSSRI